MLSKSLTGYLTRSLKTVVKYKKALQVAGGQQPRMAPLWKPPQGGSRWGVLKRVLEQPEPGAAAGPPPSLVGSLIARLKGAVDPAAAAAGSAAAPDASGDDGPAPPGLLPPLQKKHAAAAPPPRDTIPARPAGFGADESDAAPPAERRWGGLKKAAAAVIAGNKLKTVLKGSELSFEGPLAAQRAPAPKAAKPPKKQALFAPGELAAQEEDLCLWDRTGDEVQKKLLSKKRSSAATGALIDSFLKKAVAAGKDYTHHRRRSSDALDAVRAFTEPDLRHQQKVSKRNAGQKADELLQSIRDPILPLAEGSLRAANTADVLNMARVSKKARLGAEAAKALAAAPSSSTKLPPLRP
ncbi:hypothetical protein DIPPA_32942 [Diplonema papillatum]|nr:hypothetical protein DIPPA_32942 [Diplonema papillatum]